MTVETVYTDEVVARVVAGYEAVAGKDYEARSDYVAAVAAELGVSVPSVRAKLVQAGVYVAKEAKASGGKAGASKEEIVAALEAVTGKELKSFTKATKADLQTLWDFLRLASDRAEADAA